MRVENGRNRCDHFVTASAKNLEENKERRFILNGVNNRNKSLLTYGEKLILVRLERMEAQMIKGATLRLWFYELAKEIALMSP